MTHFALLEESLTQGDGGLHDFITLDCITIAAAWKIRNLDWRSIGEQEHWFSETVLLRVRRSKLALVLHASRRPEKGGSWIAFRLNHIKGQAPTIDAREQVFASYISLGGVDVPVHKFILTGLRHVGVQLRKLSFLVGLRGRKAEIKATLELAAAGASEARNLVVYDVGQGSAVGLVDAVGHPCLFFDLGWPTSFNAKSRPLDPPNLFVGDACAHCTVRKAPVILSHWDFDHWAYAVANDNYNFGKKASTMTLKPAAVDRIWIVPRPPALKKNGKGLGPTHLRLLSSLKQRIVWPNALKSVRFGAGVITRTDPAVLPDDRNNQSLVWFVMRRSEPRRAVLLAGDVSYPKARWPLPKPNLHGLVASHHGADVTDPPKRSGAFAKLAISVGDPNVYGHPRLLGLLEHAAAGWGQGKCTYTRTVWPPASPMKTGAVLLTLDASAPTTFSCSCLIPGNMGTTQ
ncbi:hypothetical protein [Variovorax boronicumulans]|uniref:hypothetical protein n=1 Tax=Variovorax boronicumulans TaxID=436515 RepID=UPI00277D816A|nr:hypothetical protein [Variovorax boronicumulans]MDQ0044669.1 hypothetical protein [Variovorax boronicumulans]